MCKVTASLDDAAYPHWDAKYETLGVTFAPTPALQLVAMGDLEVWWDKMLAWEWLLEIYQICHSVLREFTTASIKQHRLFLFELLGQILVFLSSIFDYSVSTD